MKYLLTTLCCFTLLAASASTNSPKDGGIRFKGLFLTLGDRDQGEVFNYTIDVESTGSDALQITDVTASEPWIEIESYTNTPIGKGHYGKIVLKICN